jgi:hypothetical protein
MYCTDLSDAHLRSIQIHIAPNVDIVALSFIKYILVKQQLLQHFYFQKAKESFRYVAFHANVLHA